MLDLPTFEELAVKAGPVEDEFLNWSGKAEGKPKPPIIWTDKRPKA